MECICWPFRSAFYYLWSLPDPAFPLLGTTLLFLLLYILSFFLASPSSSYLFHHPFFFSSCFRAQLTFLDPVLHPAPCLILILFFNPLLLLFPVRSCLFKGFLTFGDVTEMISLLFFYCSTTTQQHKKENYGKNYNQYYFVRYIKHCF